MIPRPGQRVWTTAKGGGDLPAGRYTGTAVGPSPKARGWWELNLDGHDKLYIAHQDYIFPLDDPPREREKLGEWGLCPWRPQQVTVEAKP